ncbi:MAG: hypothetical protein PWQ54_2320 [Bacteroidales bacterium]|jgi:hypothetical protein|nr:hypothetical protein [Bacteroidales bacterium]
MNKEQAENKDSLNVHDSSDHEFSNSVLSDSLSNNYFSKNYTIDSIEKKVVINHNSPNQHLIDSIKLVKSKDKR